MGCPVNVCANRFKVGFSRLGNEGLPGNFLNIEKRGQATLPKLEVVMIDSDHITFT
jgi:hypothetical protein